MIGALYRAGGQGLIDEAADFVQKHGKLGVGEVALTSAWGSLPSRYVIHSVGPRSGTFTNYRDFEGLLKIAFKNIIALALRNAYRSIAIPLLSAGVPFSLPGLIHCMIFYTIFLAFLKLF